MFAENTRLIFASGMRSAVVSMADVPAHSIFLPVIVVSISVQGIGVDLRRHTILVRDFALGACRQQPAPATLSHSLDNCPFGSLGNSVRSRGNPLSRP